MSRFALVVAIGASVILGTPANASPVIGRHHLTNLPKGLEVPSLPVASVPLHQYRPSPSGISHRRHRNHVVPGAELTVEQWVEQCKALKEFKPEALSRQDLLALIKCTARHGPVITGPVDRLHSTSKKIEPRQNDVANEFINQYYWNPASDPKSQPLPNHFTDIGRAPAKRDLDYAAKEKVAAEVDDLDTSDGDLSDEDDDDDDDNVLQRDEIVFQDEDGNLMVGNPVRYDERVVAQQDEAGHIFVATSANDETEAPIQKRDAPADQQRLEPEAHKFAVVRQDGQKILVSDDDIRRTFDRYIAKNIELDEKAGDGIRPRSLDYDDELMQHMSKMVMESANGPQATKDEAYNLVRRMIPSLSGDKYEEWWVGMLKHDRDENRA